MNNCAFCHKPVFTRQTSFRNVFGDLYFCDDVHEQMYREVMNKEIKFDENYPSTESGDGL